MPELVIPLPTTASGNAPSAVSYRWCKALFHALLPLRQFKLQDGSDALFVTVAAGPGVVANWDESFESPSPWDLDRQYDGFVAKVLCMSSSRTYTRVVWLLLEDFVGDASGARTKFASVIQHLEEHAVPQVPPEYIAAATAALTTR
jgi:hypothetical protein